MMGNKTLETIDKARLLATNIVITALLILYMSGPSADPLEKYTISPGTADITLVSSKIDYLIDPSGSSSFSVVQHDLQHSFRSGVDYKTIGKEANGHVIWLRIAVDTTTFEDSFWYLRYKHSRVGSIELHYKSPNGQMFNQVINDFDSNKSRKVNAPGYVFKIPTIKGVIDYYVRLETDGRPLRVYFQALTADQLLEIASKGTRNDGLFFGALIIIAIYNLILLGLLKDRAYFYYVLYLVSLVGTFIFLYGLTHRFIQMTLTTERLMMIFPVLAIQSYLLFTKNFLAIPSNTIYGRGIRTILYLSIIACVFALWAPHQHYSLLISIIASVSFLLGAVCGVHKMLCGYFPARIYNLGWGAFFLVLAAFIARSYNLIPMSDTIDFSIRFAAVFECITFSAALAYRIKITEREKVRLVLEQQEALLATKRATEAAQAALIEKNLFLSMVTHELRSALQPLVSALGRLQSRVKDIELKQSVNNIAAASSAITQYIQDLLTVFKEGGATLNLNPSSFDLIELLRGVVEKFEESARIKGVKLHFSTPVDTLFVNSDDIRIQQIASNLISNAVKYTKQGSVEIYIKPFESDSRAISFVVADTGKGISSDELSILFEPFSRLASKNVSDSTGIGLAVVDKLVKSLGGEISVQSEVDKGTKFTIVLPLLGEILNPKVPKKSLKTNSGDIKVLIVDDRIEVLRSIHETLSTLGFQVFPFTSPTDSLISAKRVEYDVAIVDLNMPGMNGYELANALREIPRQTGCMRIIAISAAENSNSAHPPLFDAFLAKPILASTIDQAISEVLLS
jgi:signal transduction histidine kinase/CheY-like chemotaxis protein